ncbi:hypothetical protein B7R21_18080 [Subtercola boreus]|uniref:Uncharacterized protein n=1 Tax=Subtercola boreus TaxID=120213 RepID=A0A3E0VDA7_9MICO|nr:ImmA/IrrE family metallo-endopeptidase [Subtercola boreus]RFA06867.1 hypothetical protein B7R21_18080 [Subtercola boreus]
MNLYTKDGELRLWIDDAEIERICDATLRKADMMPTMTSPVTDLEAFIESHLGADLDQFADLEDGILGASSFYPDGNVQIQISQTVTNAADEKAHSTGSLGRFRATLAHEAAHVVLHKRLFTDDMVTGILNHTSNSPTIPCLHRDITPDPGGAPTSPTGHWREVQANKGMAALLMPRVLFKRAARKFLEEQMKPSSQLSRMMQPTIVEHLATHFQVSKQAATIRLATLGIDRLV